MMLGGLRVSVDTVLTPAWYRARYRAATGERIEFRAFSDGPIPPWADAIDVSPETMEVLRQHFIDDDQEARTAAGRTGTQKARIA